MVGFRVVVKSSFTFETDLPPSSRNIHPSGVLHAFRSASSPPTVATPGVDDDDNAIIGAEEHTFAWIENSLHIESALSMLEKHGFSRSKSIVFVPYSTKRNWVGRYPHAEPALECTEDGRCVVHLDRRPYPNALGELDRSGDDDADVRGKSKDDGNGDAAAAVAAAEKRQRRKYYHRALNNMFQDKSYIPDAERDELHVKIYNYFSWLHAKVSELERRREAASASDGANNNADAEAAEFAGVIDDDNGNKNAESEAAEVDDEIRNKKAPERDRAKKNTGVNVTELQGLLGKMESTFLIIPNVKEEEEAAAAAAAEEEDDETINLQQQQQEGERKRGEEEPRDGEQRTEDEAASAEARQKGGGPPSFLEENLSEALFRLVVARELAGRPKRRSRKRKRQGTPNPKWVVEDFDVMFQKLVDFKEEHGHCSVPRNPHNPNEDGEIKKLGNWVQAIRNRRMSLLRDGIEYEEAVPGKRNRILTKQLTAERIDRLDSIEFVWSVAGPKVAWEDRFRELMEYREANGRWPSQSMGKLGEWVHKQRVCYAKKDKNFMLNKAPKLDEVGFEWTPRGNTRLNWDEGFEMLMEFGRINGHYNVPCPPEEVDRKSNEVRLYNWVESLHRMYKSYKLGRQAGSLTDERILLLIKNGFEFREE